MALYMDIHVVDTENFSVEDVVKAHMEDLAIQDKFGVTQLKYWVNEPAKTLFCLMEGPSKEACNEVHVQSHGNTACNIIEVSDNEYNLFMGQGTDVNDLAHTSSGVIDTGYRTILLVHALSLSDSSSQYMDDVQKAISAHEGSIILEPNNKIMGSFIYASDAIKCAEAIQGIFGAFGDEIRYSLALESGRPVDEEGDDFFEQTKLKVMSLCSLGFNNRLFLNMSTQVLAQKEGEVSDIILEKFNLLNEDEIKLLVNVAKLISDNFDQTKFTSQHLIDHLGLSKSQAYRMLKSLTGFAPNQLIQEYRLQKSLDLLQAGGHTVSEAAYDSGFNSPTYFTRTFKAKYGLTPKAILRK